MPTAAQRPHEPPSDDRSIGASIRRRRNQLNLNEAQFAAAMNMSVLSLRRAESGQVPIPARSLLDYAAGLEVPIFYFFADLACSEAPCRAARAAADTETRALLDAFNLIADPRLRDNFASLVHAIATRRTPSNDRR